MRVAYVCADAGVPVFGKKGASIHVQEVVGAFLKLGADVELFAARFDGECPPELRAVKVHRLTQTAKGDVAAREKALLALNQELRQSVEREDPFDLIYQRYSLWSFAAIEYARDSRTPSVLEVNAPLIEEQAEHRALIDRAAAERVAATVFTTANVVAAVSDGMANYIKGYPVSENRVHVIPNGVNPQRFGGEIDPSAPAEPGIFTIGFVGNLRPWHGLSVLLKAFELVQHRDERTRLLIVGGGDELEKLTANVATKSWRKSVELTGAVSTESIPGLLASMDVGVAPYPKLERFYFSPLKIYEYMAAGLPVVASRLGQIEQVIEHGRNGLLCAPGDASDLSHALIKLRSDPRLRAKLGSNARATVLARHTWDGVIEHILALAALQPSMKGTL